MSYDNWKLATPPEYEEMGNAEQPDNRSILRNRLNDSISADALAERIEVAGRHIAIDGATLANYPGDENARLSAREAARVVIWACDQLERINR